MKKTKAENGYSVTEKVKTNFQAITPPLGANKKYKAHISKYLRHILK
jgi:hypothetical protein